MRNLTSTLAWKAGEEQLQALRDLHPTSDEDLSAFADKVKDMPDWDIDEDKLSSMFEKLPRESMPGPSGMRYEHIKLEAREGNLDRLLKFFHLCTHQLLPRHIRPYLTSGILLGPSKPNGSLRPIGVREADCRCIGRMLCAQFGEEFEEFFMEEGQFGVCSKNGCEPLVHAFQTALEQHPDWDFYLVDYTNMYNTCSRWCDTTACGVPSLHTRVLWRMGRRGGELPPQLALHHLQRLG